MTNGNGNGLWRWLAAFLGGLVLALIPSLWALSQTPSGDDFSQLEAQVEALAVELARLQERLQALLEYLRSSG